MVSRATRTISRYGLPVTSIPTGLSVFFGGQRAVQVFAGLLLT